MLRGLDWDDNQKALLELAGVPPEKQVDVVNILLDDEVAAASMREAIAMVVGGEPRPPAAKELDKWASLVSAPARVRQEAYKTYLVRDMDALRRAFRDEGFDIVAVPPAAGS